MLWLKRALPLLVLIAVWFGYVFIRDALRAKHSAEDSRHALVTAQIWVASATLRANPQAFIAYRDSLLKANNMSTDQMFQYLHAYQKNPARQAFFSQRVKHFVDSLVVVLTPAGHTPPASSDIPSGTLPVTSSAPSSSTPSSSAVRRLTVQPPSSSTTARPSDTSHRTDTTQTDTTHRPDITHRTDTTRRANTTHRTDIIPRHFEDSLHRADSLRADSIRRAKSIR